MSATIALVPQRSRVGRSVAAVAAALAAVAHPTVWFGAAWHERRRA